MTADPRASLLRGRVVVVTGGGRGIGAEIAASLARAGASVAVCDVEAPKAPAYGAGYVCDVRDQREVDAAHAAVERDLGPVDVLVNNAGVLRVAKLGETTDEAWDAVIGVNLTGTFRWTRAVIDGMISRGFGRVISLASITALRGEPRTAAYAASKGGIVGFTRSLAREVAHRGVTVNAIAPGYVDTEQTRATFQGDVGAAVAAQVPMRRLGVPSDIAGAAVFLAGDGASYLTGQVITIDGGVT